MPRKPKPIIPATWIGEAIIRVDCDVCNWGWGMLVEKPYTRLDTGDIVYNVAWGDSEYVNGKLALRRLQDQHRRSCGTDTNAVTFTHSERISWGETKRRLEWDRMIEDYDNYMDRKDAL